MGHQDKFHYFLLPHQQPASQRPAAKNSHEAMDELQLIAAVVRVRASMPDAVAASVHKQLIAEGHNELSLSEVKKACSKATRQAKVSAKEEAATTAAPAPAPATTSTAASKKEAKAAKAVEAHMKAAEAHMMEANRKLRLALGDDEYSAAIATSDRGEKFIAKVTERALEARLSPAESLVPHQRAAADLATLEWMILAEKGSTLTLPEDARISAVAQIERLKRVRDSKTYLQERSWVSECFILPTAEEEVRPVAPPSDVDYTQNSSVLTRETAGASVDRALAKSGMLAGKAIGGGFDDDID